MKDYIHPCKDYIHPCKYISPWNFNLRLEYKEGTNHSFHTEQIIPISSDLDLKSICSVVRQKYSNSQQNKNLLMENKKMNRNPILKECLWLERPIGKVLEQFPKVFLPQIWNSLSPIGSAVFTYIGYKQTDRQTNKVYKIWLKRSIPCRLFHPGPDRSSP